MTEVIVYITQDNTIIYDNQTITLSPSNHSDIVITNPWYLNISSAPDFPVIETTETNDFKTFNVPDDTYSIQNYQVRYANAVNTTGNNYTFTYNDMDHKTILNQYLYTLLNNKYTLIESSYYYVLDTRPLRETDGISTSFPNNDYTPPNRNDTILLPYTYLGTENWWITINIYPKITNICVTFNSNNFNINVPEHTLYCKIASSNVESINIPEGNYTYKDYQSYIENIMNYGNTWYPSKLVNTCYNYPFYKAIRKNNPPIWFSGGDNSVFNNGYCKFHLIYPSSNGDYIGHPINGPVNHRCLSCVSGLWNIDNFINYINTTDNNKLFNCISTEHEILLTADQEFIINPACSMTKLGEADITPEGNVNYNFAKSKRLMYHPQYKQINCTITYDNNTFTVDGRYTPAEFLRKVNELTDNSININGNQLSLINNFNISENPFISIENGQINNICGLSTTVKKYTFYYAIYNLTYPSDNYAATGQTIQIIPSYEGTDVEFSAEGLLNAGSINSTTGVITITSNTPATFTVNITAKNKISTEVYTINITYILEYKTYINKNIFYYDYLN